MRRFMGVAYMPVAQLTEVSRAVVRPTSLAPAAAAAAPPTQRVETVNSAAGGSFTFKTDDGAAEAVRAPIGMAQDCAAL